MAKTFEHEPDDNRYALRIDGTLAAAAEYRISGGDISFTHTFTASDQRGKGLAGEIVAFAMDDVESTSERRVIPMCSYVGQWFEKHPERSHLLRGATER